MASDHIINFLAVDTADRLRDMEKEGADYPIIQPFFASVLLFSQAATTRALMPLGISLGIPAPSLIGMWPSVNGYFFLPTYGSLIAAVNLDRTGATRIGRFVVNHSFMLPALVATVAGVTVGLVITNFVF